MDSATTVEQALRYICVHGNELVRLYLCVTTTIVRTPWRAFVRETLPTLTSSSPFRILCCTESLKPPQLTTVRINYQVQFTLNGSWHGANSSASPCIYTEFSQFFISFSVQPVTVIFEFIFSCVLYNGRKLRFEPLVKVYLTAVESGIEWAISMA